MKPLMILVAVTLLAVGSMLNRPRTTFMGALVITAGLALWVLALYPRG
jgi:hypothetical protein